MDWRLNISEVASLYKISARTLLYYEEIGILKSHRKTDSKYREYTSEQCKQLEVILLLRRLSFSVKMIAELLSGDDSKFREVLREKITHSSQMLLEAQETNRLLRNFESEISLKPVSDISIADILNEYAYPINKTDRMFQMKPQVYTKYRVVLVVLGIALAQDVCNENAGNLLNKITILRSHLEKKFINMPLIGIFANIELMPNQALIIWDDKEIWRKDFKSEEACLCADEIIAQLRLKSTAKN